MFEGKLAKKYIFAQKRHSALTVCSIVIALALIIMLFSMLSTVFTCLRNIAYSDEPYHIRIWGTGFGMDKEMYDAVAEAVSEYGTCTAEEEMISGKAVYYADILFDKRIDNASLFVGRIEREIGIDDNDDLIYSENEMLIMLDVKDSKAGLYMSGIIAVIYVFVLFLIMMLRLIIDTAFEISSKERERQFGVLQSIGATPKQIVRIITYEGMMLSAVGIPIGTAAGIGLGYLVYRAVLGTGLADLYLTPSRAAELMRFSVNPWLLLLGVVTGLGWVLLSAYGTGMRVIKMSPVQAISQRANTVKKVGRAPLFGKLFGWTGKLASRNNLRQPKRFIATVISLTLSIAIFSAVTVAVNDLSGAVDDYYAYRVGGPDFSCLFSYNSEDGMLFGCKALRQIEESGLFDDIYFNLETGAKWENPALPDEYPYDHGIYVSFLNRNGYDHHFHGDPPIPYDEFAASGGYLVSKSIADVLGSKKTITVSFRERTPIFISEEEYNALTPEEQEKYYIGSVSGGVTLHGYYPEFVVDLDIYGTTTESYPTLSATVDQYENGASSLFSNLLVTYNSMEFNLAEDADYYDARDFLDRNSIPYIDNTAANRQAHAMLTSVNIVATFLSVMIALIAVVNMINILATGILNRRAELAALQCVGMTEKNLRKMTVIECLQYALTSGIAAISVCELMMFLTEKMMYIVLKDVLEEMKYLETVISYVQPLPIIAVATVCAFAVALAASITAQRAMKRTSLVEQIRSVE